MTFKCLLVLAALVTLTQVRKVYCNSLFMPRAVAALQVTFQRTLKSGPSSHLTNINFAGVVGPIRQDACLLVIQRIQGQPRLQRTDPPQKKWEVESVSLLHGEGAQ